MDLQRLFLLLTFAFSSILVWDGWQRYQNPDKYAQNTSQSVATQVNKVAESKSILQQGSTVQEANRIAEQTVTVTTDLYRAEISNIGGDITRLELLKHPDGFDKTKPFVLFARGKGTHNFVAQTGLLGTGLPNHNSIFTAEKTDYSITDNSDTLRIKLEAENSSSLKVYKILTFHKGSYLIDVTFDIENTGSESVKSSSYFQFVRDSESPAGSSKFVPTYTGPAVYTDKEKFQKINFSDIEKGKANYVTESEDGWIGMLQHYFVSAWLPTDKTKREYFTRKLDGDLYSAGFIFPEQEIKPGEKKVISTKLYSGPAKSDLNEIAPGLGLTVDYGWVTVLASPLFWLMSLLFDITGNWGVAIILLTVLIKLLFFPLSAASYRSMAKMRTVAPKLEKIKEKYGDDRDQLNRAMMDLYKTEKINPLGGCLPVLIQIPVFIALFWAILSSVEMRYAPFYGWLTDLSTADPYYVLPIIMGISMVVQSRLNPPPPDPMQAKLMQIMPVAFSFVFFFFPAGLVLYSIVNNLLSILQQWYITRMAESESKGVAKR